MTAPARRHFLPRVSPPKRLLKRATWPPEIDHLAVAAGPGRVHLGVDVEGHGVALLAPGRARLEGRAVGHLHLDHMVIGMGAGLHVVDFLEMWLVPTSLDRKVERAL